jgi:hypothetical protein
MGWFMKEDMKDVWIFHGEGGRFSSGVFDSLKKAEEWIGRGNLSGILSQYPVNKGIYDWALENEYFEIKTEKQSTPKFIQTFTSGSQEHYHFENGKRE